MASINYNKLLVSVNQDILGKLIISKMAFMFPTKERKPHMFKVLDINVNPKNTQISVMKLFDQNGVQLDLKKP